MDLKDLEILFLDAQEERRARAAFAQDTAR